METYSLSLSLFDFIPTLAFLVGAFFLVRLGRVCRGNPTGRMLMAGGLLVFLGGFFKATWKLLYTLEIADIQWMSQGQFVLSSIGFLAVFTAVLYMARVLSRINPARIVPAISAWKIPFLFLMTVTSLGAEGILAYLAFRRRARLAAAGFVIGVLGILAMGALASAEQTVAMQWIEEVTNTVGQLGFMTGSIQLYLNFKVTGCEMEGNNG